MEPFRVIVDRHVYYNLPTEFGKNEKYSLWRILEDTVKIDDSRHSVLDAIKIYTRSVFEAINDGDPSKIKYYSENICENFKINI